MALQCLMLAVEIERLRLKDILSQPNTSSNNSESRATHTNQQDLDAEERGVMGDSVDESGDIEMQSLRPPRDTEEEERDQLLAEPREIEDVDDTRHALDIYFSGQTIVGDFHILHTLRTQWNDYQNAVDRSAATTASSSAIPTPGTAMRTAQRNARLPTPLRRFMESRRQ